MTMTMNMNEKAMNPMGESTFQEFNLLTKLEEEFDYKLKNLEGSLNAKISQLAAQKSTKVEEKVANLERKYSKTEEQLERFRNVQEKLERKLKEVVEQNVSIKIQLDSYKTKQVHTDRQLGQLMSQPQVMVEFNELQKRCDEMLHQARAEISRAFLDSNQVQTPMIIHQTNDISLMHNLKEQF